MMALCLMSLPPASTFPALFLSFALTAAAGRFVRFDRERAQKLWQKIMVLSLGVSLPMLQFGIVIAAWAWKGDAGTWIVAIGVLALTSMFASVVLVGRLPAVVAAVSSLWLPLVLLSGAVNAFVLLFTGVAASALTVVRLTRIRNEVLADIRKEERIRSRALEILIDYEETGQGWFWEADAQGLISYVSPTVGEILGHKVDALVGRPFTDLIVLDEPDNECERALHFHLSARTSFQDLAARAATVGDERWWSISGRPIHDRFGNFAGFRGFGTDLTERRRSEEHAARLAHYDSLTGLANRFQMSKTLEGIIRTKRTDKRSCAVFLLDLDRFKQVNDTLGHPAGDALLKQVAQRLERAVDKAGRVGRLGGDEFQVILPGRIDRDGLADLARRIIDSLSHPYLIEGQRVVIGASVGIAVSPQDGMSSEALIRNADLALYAAKDGGRGRYHFYASDLHSDAEERRQLEHDLRDAVAHGGLELVYQPIVHTATEKITGFEALLRWNHPALGPLSPAKFIPIAEDTGLIAQIGEWALRTACHDLALWPEPISVAVNVSPLQFANPALPSIVTNALASAQVCPSRLELEITESVFLTYDEGLDAIFAALKHVGVRLALDDFGTGYSSLGYLKQAPFDKIKIDRSFVTGATVEGSSNGAIIAAIVSLAGALGMDTTAEGVETLDELDLVRMLGCSHVQGFIYERPLSASAASVRLKSGLNAIAHGPRVTRAIRRSMLRTLVIHLDGEQHHGKVRNLSANGALIEGLKDVPPGTVFDIQLSDDHLVQAVVCWCGEACLGVEFPEPLTFELIDDLTGPVDGAEPVLTNRAGQSSRLRRIG